MDGCEMNGYKIVGIIQDRTGNSRLPNKSLYLLADKPMSVCVYERVKKSKLLSEVVMATTTNPRDDVLCELAEFTNLKVFRGSEDDVVSRFYECARWHDADYIVRMAADNPLIEASEIDRLIEFAIENDLPFASNSGDCASTAVGYPDGLGAEIYSMAYFFEEIYKTATDREHPHKNVTYKTEHRLKCPKEYAFPDVRLDINTLEDYQFIKKIFDKFGHNDFNVTQYIQDVR